MGEHRDFPHFIDLGAVFRGARFAPEKKSTNTGFQWRDQVEHQRDAAGIAGLGEAIELIFGRVGHRGLGEKNAKELRGRSGGLSVGAAHCEPHFGQYS
jgi:hypothetical protein